MIAPSFLLKNLATALHSRRRYAVVIGALGCAFGVLGFPWGVTFIVLATLCGIAGIVSGIIRRSAAGTVISTAAVLLAIWGFVISPHLLAGVTVAFFMPASPSTNSIDDPPSTDTNQPNKNHPDPATKTAQIAAIRIQNRITNLNSLIARMETFETYVDATTRKALGIEQRYQSISLKMQTDLETHLSLTGKPNASVKRKQLATSINQNVLAMTRQHDLVQHTLQFNYENYSPQLMDQVNISEQNCRDGVRVTDINLMPPEDESVRAACGKLLDADANFRAKFAELGRSLVQLEVVYQTERDRQQKIVQTLDLRETGSEP